MHNGDGCPGCLSAIIAEMVRWVNRSSFADHGAWYREHELNRILRTREVVAAIGLSKTTIWRRVRSGEFPLPVKLGGPESRSIGWRQDDIDEWIGTRPEIDN